MKRIQEKGGGVAVALLSGVLQLTSTVAHSQQTEAPSEPLAVRHDTPRAGRELLILRHQRLVKGSHQRFYELSRDAVWPLYEKIGTRVVGQWQIVYPEGGGSDDYDEGYRLARYRSFNHWVATQRPDLLGGNGPDYLAGREAIRARNELRLGSDGAILLEGSMAPGGPYYFPPLAESSRSDAGSASEGEPRAVRHEVAQPGEGILTLRYFKIEKGTFEEFHRPEP